jgi:hypothetical protein
MAEFTAAGKPRKRRPGAGRPTKHGEGTRSIRVAMSISTELVSTIPNLQRVLDYWEDDYTAAGENSARHHFLKQCLRKSEFLGFDS